MRRYFVETPRGNVVLSGEPAIRESSGPVVLLVHGSFRAPAAMFPIAERLAGVDCVFLHLPGHADAPDLDDHRLKSWLEAVSVALRVYLPGRKITAVGESVGALLALGLPVQSVVAIEPFLSTDNIWPLRSYIARRPGRGLPATTPLIEHVLTAQDYHWLLRRITAPALVLGGMEPLQPERPQPVRPGIVDPSFLDEADFATFAALPLVTVRRVAGGHALVDQNPDACAQAAMEMLGAVDQAR